MNFYNKYILPKIIDFAMKGKVFEVHRRDVVANAKGIVLEIGFGSGLNLPYYIGVAKLYALEPSRELWQLAREKINNAGFEIEHLQDSAESIPLKNDSVDFVVSTWTLCSIPDIQTALQEIKRVLKPQGKFVFVDHGRSPGSFKSGLQNFLTPFSKSLTGGCHLNRDIEALIKEAGFEIKKIEKFSVKSKPLVFMYKGTAEKP